MIVAIERPIRSIQQREKLFEEWYISAFPAVASFVKKMGGNLEDAKDIFQDALVIYYEKQHSVKETPTGYIVGIAKHLWIRKFKKQRSEVVLDEQERDMVVSDDYFPSVDANRLLKVLEVQGQKCLDMLRSFYYEKVSIKELAGRFGFQSEHSASVQKYKCLEKMRNTVKQNAYAYEDFLE